MENHVVKAKLQPILALGLMESHMGREENSLGKTIAPTLNGSMDSFTEKGLTTQVCMTQDHQVV